MLLVGHKMQKRVTTKFLFCERVGVLLLVVFTLSRKPPLVTKKLNARVPTHLYRVHIAHTRFNEKAVSKNTLA